MAECTADGGCVPVGRRFTPRGGDSFLDDVCMSLLQQRLELVSRRGRRLRAAAGALSTAAAVLLWGLAAATVETWLHLEPPLVRMMLTLSAVALAAGLGWRNVVRPLMQRERPLDCALRIEQQLPEHRHILASGLEFERTADERRAGASPAGQPAAARQVASPAPSSQSRATTVAAVAEFVPRGPSPELQQRVIAAAERALDGLTEEQLQHLASPRPVRRRAALLGAACVAVLACVLSAPGSARFACQRLVDPWGAGAWPRNTTLQWLDADLAPVVDLHEAKRVAQLQPCTLYLVNQNGPLPADVVLHRIHPDGQESTSSPPTTTRRTPEGRDLTAAVVTLSPDAGLHRLRAVGGDDDRLPMLVLEAAAPPQLVEFKVVVTPPDYSGLPPETAIGSSASTRGLVGSKVRIEATADVPLAKVALHREGRVPQSLPLADHGRKAFATEFLIDSAGRSTFWFTYADTRRLEPSRFPKFDLLGLDDQPPSVAWTSADDDALALTPSARLEYFAVFRDDWGLQQAWIELRSEPQGEAPAAVHDHRLDALPSLAREFTAVDAWPLDELSLTPGQRLELQALARDARPAAQSEERIGRSSVRIVQIISPEELRRRLADEERELRRSLAQSLESARRSDAQLRELRAQWRAARNLPGETPETLEQLAHAALQAGRDLGESGLLGRVQRLRESWRINQLDADSAMSRLQSAADQVQRAGQLQLGDVAGPLQHAGDLLPSSTERTRSPEALLAPAEQQSGVFDEALASAEQAQRQSTEALAAAVDALEGWLGQYDAQQALASVVDGQTAVASETAAASQSLLARPAAEQSPAERSSVAVLAERQQQIAETLERLLSQMQATPQGPTNAPTSPADPSSPVGQFVERIRQGGAAAHMQTAAQHLRQSNFGAALAEQQVIGDLLEDARRTLESPASMAAAALAEALETASRDVELLRRAERDLLAELSSVRGPASADGVHRERIRDLQSRQQSLSTRASELAERLTTQKAAAVEGRAPARRAADSLQRSAELLEDADVPGAARQAERALDELDQLQSELESARRRAEQLAAVNRRETIRQQAAGLAERQQRLLEETVRLDGLQSTAGRLSRSQLLTLRQSAVNQRQLADDAAGLAELLDADVRMAALVCRQAADDMQGAAAELDNRETGFETQTLQARARERLLALAAAWEETPAPGDTPTPETSTDAESPGSPDAGSLDSDWLPQVKLLLVLEEGLAARSRELHESLGGTAPAELSPEAAEEIDELAREQAALRDAAKRLLRPLEADEESPESFEAPLDEAPLRLDLGLRETSSAAGDPSPAPDDIQTPAMQADGPAPAVGSLLPQGQDTSRVNPPPEALVPQPSDTPSIEEAPPVVAGQPAEVARPLSSDDSPTGHPSSEAADTAPEQGLDDKAGGDEAAADLAAPGALSLKKQLASDALRALETAAERLNAGQLDQETIDAQQQSTDALRRLLEELRDSADSQWAEGGGPAPQVAGDSSERTAGESHTGPGGGLDAPETAESGAAVQPQAPAAGESIAPRDALHAVWGHLPPKMQEELARSFSEEFAPEYAEQVREYFQKLAEHPPGADARDVE